jgi:predicted negative regulator of RcsB-dependent stress response
MESDVTQSAAFYKTWAWVETHKKQLMIGAAGVLVVGLGVGFYIYQQNEKQAAASMALSRVASQSSTTGQAAAPEAFQKIAAEYPGTGGGERASLVAGVRLFDLAKYSEAATQFQKFLSEYPNSDFTGQALLGIAASLEAQGKTAEALKAYKDVTERRPSDSVVPQAKLAIARLNEASGNLAQARDTYEQIARPEFGSIGQVAAAAFEALVAKHPELAQKAGSTNALVSPAPVINLK